MKLPIKYTHTHPQVRREAREQYIKEQDGDCYWCKSSLKQHPPKEIIDQDIDWDFFPDNFLKWPVHLQHDHATDLTEGAVHAYCNAVMWQYHGR